MTNPDATPPETRAPLRVAHVCTIADKGVGPSWWVRFDDGQTAPVHSDELTPLSSGAPQAETPTADRTVQTETEE